MAVKKKKKDIKKGSDSKSDSYLDSGEELTERGIYYISDHIETDTLLKIHQDILLKHLSPTWKDDVTIIINTYGGDVAETWSLIDLLRWVRMDVRTTGMGACASAGACLVACGTPGKRLVTLHTEFMIHGASGGIHGNRQQLAAGMKYMEDEHQKDIRFWMRHSKYKTKEEVEKKFLDGQDKWMTAEEAYKHGVVDGVIGLDLPPDKKKKGKK